MRIFGLVIMKEKRYDELDRFIWNQFEKMLVKIGAGGGRNGEPIAIHRGLLGDHCGTFGKETV